MGLAVDGANRHDMKRVRASLESLVVARPEPTAEPPQGRCLDQGYDFDAVRQTWAAFGLTAPIRARGEEAKAIQRLAGKQVRRWGVERRPSWLNRLRRIRLRWHKKPEPYLALLHFARALIAFRAAGLVG